LIESAFGSVWKYEDESSGNDKSRIPIEAIPVQEAINVDRKQGLC
jgi:hypothetical protein